MRNLLLVSNGHAEDLTAASIGEEIKKISPSISLKAFPLVGLGKAYDTKGIENLGLRKVFPSGGFAKEGPRYLVKDVKAGLFGSLMRQIKILKSEGKRADLIVAVGDIFLAALCGFFTRKPLIYIDGPNSVRIRKYYPIERWVLKKFCRKVIVQDKETAEYLKSENIPGEYLGTWVMDYVPLTGEDFGIESQHTIIGILPGTREEAYDNLQLILSVVEAMAKQQKEIVGLVAFALDREKLKSALSWKYDEYNALEKGITAKVTSPSGTTFYLAEGRFGDVCKASKLIIGLAGIANEQAVGFGTPVVAFPGKGPQTTLRRWKEIHHITGDSMAVLAGSTDEIAAKALEILNDPARLKSMRQIGLDSKKDRGAIPRIARFIIEYLK